MRRLEKGGEDLPMNSFGTTIPVASFPQPHLGTPVYRLLFQSSPSCPLAFILVDILGSLGISMTHVSAEEDSHPTPPEAEQRASPPRPDLAGTWMAHTQRPSLTSQADKAAGDWSSSSGLPLTRGVPPRSLAGAWDTPEHLGLMEQHRFSSLTYPQQTELSQLTFPEAGEVSRKENQ